MTPAILTAANLAHIRQTLQADAYRPTQTREGRDKSLATLRSVERVSDALQSRGAGAFTLEPVISLGGAG